MALASAFALRRPAVSDESLEERRRLAGRQCSGFTLLACCIDHLICLWMHRASFAICRNGRSFARAVWYRPLHTRPANYRHIPLSVSFIRDSRRVNADRPLTILRDHFSIRACLDSRALFVPQSSGLHLSRPLILEGTGIEYYLARRLAVSRNDKTQFFTFYSEFLCPWLLRRIGQARPFPSRAGVSRCPSPL
ncbi:hypothetical protein BJX70DRAFT_228821 [Aspergillus crustosus]